MYIFTLYLLIIGLVIWAVGQHYSIRMLKLRFGIQSVLLKTALENVKIRDARIAQRDKLIAQDESLIREMSHMASSVEEWPSVIMMQGNGEKDSLA